VWFRRKNTVSRAAYTPPGTRTSHRRTIPATPPIAEWIGQDADRLEASAAEAEARAEKLLADAVKWRALAAAYRVLTVAPEPEPAPVERLHRVDPDPSQFNPTWQLPQEPGMCGCRHAYGESCELCDTYVSEGLSILTPWTPDAHDTAVQPLVNGWAQ